LFRWTQVAISADGDGRTRTTGFVAAVAGLDVARTIAAIAVGDVAIVALFVELNEAVAADVGLAARRRDDDSKQVLGGILIGAGRGYEDGGRW
jgi:hypothetical protein